MKVLEDDKKLFPPYQGAPLLREETLKKYPQLEKILGKLAGKITTEEMTNMNYAVNILLLPHKHSYLQHLQHNSS